MCTCVCLSSFRWRHLGARVCRITKKGLLECQPLWVVSTLFSRPLKKTNALFLRDNEKTQYSNTPSMLLKQQKHLTFEGVLLLHITNHERETKRAKKSRRILVHAAAFRLIRLPWPSSYTIPTLRAVLESQLEHTHTSFLLSPCHRSGASGSPPGAHHRKARRNDTCVKCAFDLNRKTRWGCTQRRKLRDVE